MIPESVKIGAYQVKVNLVKNQISDEQKFGCYNARLKLMTIDPDVSDPVKFSVFLHEMFEVIADIYDIRALQEDHHAITLLETALHQIVRDNPELLK